MFYLPESCQCTELVFALAKSGHPIPGCTLSEVFIVKEQEMQEFGRLSMLSGVFVGHVTLCTLHLAQYCGNCWNCIPSHSIPSLQYNNWFSILLINNLKKCKAHKSIYHKIHIISKFLQHSQCVVTIFAIFTMYP